MEMSELAAVTEITCCTVQPDFKPVADNSRQNKNHPSAGDKSGQACRGVISVRAARGCGVNIYKLWVGEGDCW